jgi:membrane-associated phospholipid phosphatase
LGAVTICALLSSRRLGIVAAIIAAVVAFARVFVGVHYISDVIGGFVLGLLCGGLIWWITSLTPSAFERMDRVLISCHLRPAGR